MSARRIDDDITEDMLIRWSQDVRMGGQNERMGDKMKE